MKDKGTSATDFDKTREQIHRQMLSAVSHDLKTPLATIIGSLEVYTRMEGKLSQEKKMMLIKCALVEAYRLDDFMTNILDMAKLENGLVKIRKESCDLTTLLQDSVTRIGSRAEQGSIKLQYKGKRDKTVVCTDPILLGKAVGILLDNALKHAVKQPIIKVEYGLIENNAYIRVCDNGPGIAPKNMEDIFSKYACFSQNDQQNAGIGLGLSICRQIMILLSGSVTVENRPEGGADFILTCPSQ